MARLSLRRVRISERVVTTALELAGAGLVVAGVALVFVPAAFIVGGVALLGISYNLTRKAPVTQ